MLPWFHYKVNVSHNAIVFYQQTREWVLPLLLAFANVDLEICLFVANVSLFEDVIGNDI